MHDRVQHRLTLSATVLCALGLLLAPLLQAVAAPSCLVSDVTTLQQCMAQLQSDGTIVFTKDIVCGEGDDCAMDIRDVTGVVIDGQGHRVPAGLSISGGQDITCLLYTSPSPRD